MGVDVKSKSRIKQLALYKAIFQKYYKLKKQIKYRNIFLLRNKMENVIWCDIKIKLQ